MAVTVTADRIKTYAGFVKLEHTVFSLPLIYAGVILATPWPSARLLVMVLVAAMGGRATALALNRLIDAKLDRLNPRTRMRELPSGAMRVWEGWLILIVASAVYVTSAALIGPICLALSPIPLALFVLYPYLKRFTSLAHVGLGLAWSTAPLGGWLAGEVFQAGREATLAGVEWLNLFVGMGFTVGWLWVFSILWVAGFDIIYGTMDEAFDREHGLHSLPVALGTRPALFVASLLHLAAFVCLWMLWRTQLHTTRALAWLAAIGALFIWQHAIADRKPEFAFFQLNGMLGFLVFAFVWAGV